MGFDGWARVLGNLAGVISVVFAPLFVWFWALIALCFGVMVHDLRACVDLHRFNFREVISLTSGW